MNENATRPLTRPEAEELFERLSRSASRRRRVRAWVRTATVIGVSIVLVGTLTWAMLSLLGLRKNTSPASGDAQLSTYRLEDVRVVYPYVDPRTGEPDETRAGIEGVLYWTSEKYPGVHRCTFTAYGPDGSTVGRDQGEVSALSEGHRTSMPISVSGAAVSGEITCDPTRLDTPVAYEIRDAHVASVLDPQSGELVGARVLYTVVWPEGVELPDYPGTNACTVRFARASGEPVADWRFTLSAPPGRSETPEIGLSDLPGVTSLPEIDELTATVGCVPFTGDSSASPNGAGQATSDATPSGEAADVLRLACSPDGTPEVLTSVVRPQPDGLHVIVDNRSNAEAVIVRHPSRPYQAWSSGSNGLDDEFVMLTPPGEAFVSCMPVTVSPTPAPSPGAPLQPNEASFAIVDDGSWVSADPVCGLSDRWSFQVQTSVSTHNGWTPAEAAARLVPGIRPSDVVERAGYLGSPFEDESVRVVRDGQVLAWMRAHSHGYWSFDGFACLGSGIGDGSN